MTPARPMACVYEKWYRGIVQAVPDPAERCALLEYIVQYQLHVIYGAAEQPNKENLPQAARIAVVMLEGDLEELCASRIDHNEKCRQNGRKRAAAADTDTDTLTDPNRVEQGLTDPNSPYLTPQNKTNQNKSKQNKSKREGGGNFCFGFEFDKNGTACERRQTFARMVCAQRTGKRPDSVFCKNLSAEP